MFGNQLLQDVRYALRTAAASPMFTAMAMLSLALGIGANTAIYSFMDAFLMRALPVAHPESLVVMNWHTKDFPKVSHSFDGGNYKDPKTGLNSGNFPYPAFELFQTQNSIFSTLFAFKRAQRPNVIVRNQAEQAATVYVSGQYFSGLELVPASGRLIDRNDDKTGAAPAAVISFKYWQARFGGDRNAIGESFLINNSRFTLAGVAPPEFFGVDPEQAVDIYVPMHSAALIETGKDPQKRYIDKNFYWVEIMGRLRPGVEIRQAQAALAPMFQQFVESTASNAEERSDLPALVVREGAGGLDQLRRQFSQPLYILMAMVGLILAIACANIANLLLARSTARRREMAVRLSLGAGRWRIVRQLLTESVLLSAMGAGLGLLFAVVGARYLTTIISDGGDGFAVHASLSWNVLGVTAALTMATGILFGLIPAIQSSRIDLTPALKESRASEPRARLRLLFLRAGLSQFLVVAQIAIALLLLVAAGLFVRTLSNLNSIELGFNRENLLLFNINAKQAGYKGEGLVRFYGALQARLRSLPGVRNVTLSDFALVEGSMAANDIVIPGRPADKDSGTPVIRVGPSFFSTMQIPILLGREIGERDMAAINRVAVVNELFVKKFFNGENPVGKHFQYAGDPSDIEIIGVSKTARYSTLKRDIPTVAYVSFTDNAGGVVYELRVAGDPLVLTNAVRQIVQQSDAHIPVTNIRTQAAQIDETISGERRFAGLCTAFAVLALVMACVGLYGTMAYNVARRTGEIGIRMALGAQRGRVVWMVLREAVALAVVGLAIGLPIAYSASSVVKEFLFGMKPADPVAIMASVAILAASAIFAGYLPARRASRIDPVRALRDE